MLSYYTEPFVDLTTDIEDDLFHCPPQSANSHSSTSTSRLDSPTALILNEIYSLSNSREAGASSLVTPTVGVRGSGESSGAVGTSDGVGGRRFSFLENNELRPVCTFCGKDFKNRNTLNNHTSVYHRDEKRRMKGVDEMI